MPFLGSVDAFELGRAIKRIRPDLPVILLAHSLRASFLDRSGTEGIDKIFIWCCEADLLLALVKNVEDHRNVDSDTQKTIRQIPNEELVNISKRIKAKREGEMGAGGLQGLLYDHKA